MTLALWVADRAGGDVRPFRMRVESELGAGAGKAGLGGSASVVTGVAAAVLAWTGLEPTSAAGRARLFKVAALSHFMAQEKRGSGADVAAAVHGGLSAYRNPGLGELMRSVDAAGGLPGLVDRFWEELRTEPILWPPGHAFVAGATGSGASTRELIDRLDALEGHGAARYATLRAELGRILHDAIARGTPDAWKSALDRHQDALARFDAEIGGAGIVTPAIGRLVSVARELGLPAKISGAGGGDSVISLAARDEVARLEAAWRAAGAETLVVDRPIEGVRIDGA
jgi:ERG8-type phosphomevalonate kinase